MDEQDELVFDARLCTTCDKEVQGIVHDGYLWPLWMRNANATKFPPHGPRVFHIEKSQCWCCAVKEDEEWYR